MISLVYTSKIHKLSHILWKSFSHVWLFATPWTIQSMELSRPEYWMGSFSILQQIFPTQGLKPGIPHCRQILYQLSHRGSSNILYWTLVCDGCGENCQDDTNFLFGLFIVSFLKIYFQCTFFRWNSMYIKLWFSISKIHSMRNGKKPYLYFFSYLYF